MSLRSQLVTVVLAMLAALLAFHLLHRQMLAVFPPAGASAELVLALEQSQTDLKHLAHADPANRAAYHARFDELQALVNRLRIVEHNRDEIAARQQALVLAAAAVSLVALGAAVLALGRRDARRLKRVGDALAQLAAGTREVRLSDRGSDHIGVIARMIERTSDVVGRDRQRLAVLRGLEAWQEAARRQAHELRTPLTVARLEIDRLQERVAALGDPSDLTGPLAEVRAEIQRLDGLVQRFASFARLPPPERRPEDVRELVREFACTFAEAWPALRLETVLPGTPCRAAVDRAMIRQVLVNLCDNTARALAGAAGTVTLTVRPPSDEGGRHGPARVADPKPGPGPSAPRWLALEVVDDGPGIAADLRSRVFEPYVTTAEPGRGMGLGLAICRKILLDHDGDLELLEAERGAAFRLLLPAEAECRA